MVAPNGARFNKRDHPALPITIAETVECAIACNAVGADGLHAHIRDEQGNHLLDRYVYAELIRELETMVPEMKVQITTEAVDRYSPDFQMEIALGSGAKMVSVSIRELSTATPEATSEFYLECEAKDIAIQHILYDTNDCALLQQRLPHKLFSSSSLQLLFVLGRYSESKEASPSELKPFLRWLSTAQLSPDWAVCAFGKKETECLMESKRHGGKCRIGFENSFFLRSGEVAEFNAEKVEDFRCAIDEAIL